MKAILSAVLLATIALLMCLVGETEARKFD